MLAKFGAYFITGSNFVLTDAAESIVNILAGSFAFFSVYLASMPRDENHPYGHGKVEYFSAFIEGTLISIAALAIMTKSAYSFFYPEKVHALPAGAIIIGITGVINGVMGWYLIRKGKILSSVTLDADGRHLVTDMVTSGGLVIGLLIINFTGILWLDGVFSILVSLFILVNGYKLVRKSVAALMDEADFTVVNKTIAVLNQQRRDSWIDIHNFRAQKYGTELHIDCHLTLPNYFDLVRVHNEVTAIDQLINREVPRTELFIHVDPCIPECCHYCGMPDCPIRSEQKTEQIEWTLDKIIRNKKHFE